MESAPAPAARLSLPQRIWGVLVSPRIVFESLRERPHVLGALLVLAVLSLGAGYLMTEPAIADQMRRMAESEQAGNAEAEQTAIRVMRIALPVGYMAGGTIPLFVVAGVLLFIGNVLLGGGARYKQLLSMMAHVSMVTIPMTLVRVPLSLSRNTLDVPLSPAAFLPTSAQGTFLYVLLNQFDVFNLWMLGLSILGTSIMAGIPVRKAAVGILVAWVIWLAVSVPLQAAFG